MTSTPDPVRAGQESVRRYPRSPVAERTHRHLRVEHRGLTIADIRAGVRTLETSHAPTYYLPPADVRAAVLRPAAEQSWCEWKGRRSIGIW